MVAGFEAGVMGGKAGVANSAVFVTFFDVLGEF
jgi:hypothetical protein